MAGDGFEVRVAAFDEVEADTVEFEELDRLIDVGDVAEIRVEQHADTVAARRQDARVERLEQAHVLVVLVKHEVGFVELHP